MMGEPVGEFGPMPASFYLYTETCDETYLRTLEAGGVSVMEVTTMDHAGERYAPWDCDRQIPCTTVMPMVRGAPGFRSWTSTKN
jgi:hypothetical protein